VERGGRGEAREGRRVERGGRGEAREGRRVERGGRGEARVPAAYMTLYFFERVTDDDFVGPVIIAAADEAEAWAVLGRRESAAVETLKSAHWHVAQELTALPSRAGVIYPAHYRRAIL
jgi:hypothetical protein